MPLAFVSTIVIDVINTLLCASIYKIVSQRDFFLIEYLELGISFAFWKIIDITHLIIKYIYV